jgi:hypothetical protein
MQTIPTWLQQAFIDWLTRRLYLDGGGNYRFRPSRRVAPYSWQLKRLCPDNQHFHAAADAWLSLWEHVPTARLNGKSAVLGPGRTSRRRR